MADANSGTILNTIQELIAYPFKWFNTFKKYSGQRTIADIASITSVEPLTIVSKDCVNLQYIGDVQNSLLNLFCAYYLQAVNYLTKVTNIKEIKVLAQLNPNRRFSELGLESFNNHIALEHALPGTQVLALEAGPIGSDKLDQDNTRTLAENANLSVGKMLNITVMVPERIAEIEAGTRSTDRFEYERVQTEVEKEVFVHMKDNNGKVIYSKKGKPRGELKTIKVKEDAVDKDGNPIFRKIPTSSDTSTHRTDDYSRMITLPVSVRLMANLLSNESTTNLLAHNTGDITITERWHKWRAGRIQFWRDLVFAQDLIDEYKKIALKDETAIINKIQAKAAKNKTIGLLTSAPTLATASNLFVIDEYVAKEVEARMGGKFTDTRMRERLFDNTYGMIIAVIDREYERVRFYTRGIDDYTDLSVKELKNASKGKGPDIMDMMKSIVVGNAPSF